MITFKDLAVQWKRISLLTNNSSSFKMVMINFYKPVWHFHTSAGQSIYDGFMQEKDIFSDYVKEFLLARSVKASEQIFFSFFTVHYRYSP